jgi:hypothetical protein
MPPAQEHIEAGYKDGYEGEKSPPISWLYLTFRRILILPVWKSCG